MDADLPALDPDLAELPELDLETDPLTTPGDGPSAAWLAALEATPVRAPYVIPGPPLTDRIDAVLTELEGEGPSPTPDLVGKAETLLRDLRSFALDGEEFVAASFQTHRAAWVRLLSGSNRTSSKKVLQWVSEGLSHSSSEPGQLSRKTGV